MSSRTRVAVLDEQEIVHYGLRAYFSGLPDIVITDTYRIPHGALRAVERGEVDLLLMGRLLKSSDSLDFIRALTLQHPELRVLGFLAEPCPATIEGLLESGVHGIVCKHQPLHICVQAIRLLASGQQYWCSGVTHINSSDPAPLQTAAHDAEAEILCLPSLTLKEREVLRLCISGLTVTRIAELFNRSLKTVSTQKQAAYRKLGLRNDMELFRRLARYGA